MATNNNNMFDINPSMLDYAAMLSPAMFNITQSFAKPDRFDYISSNSLYSPNKNANAALDILAKRRYNPNQALYRTAQNANIAKYNARNLNTNSGANMAYDAYTSANKMAQDADILDKSEQVNNQYLADYANTLAQTGAQNAANESSAKQMALQYNNQANLYNLQSKAARTNLLGTGIKQMADIYQNLNKDKRIANADKVKTTLFAKTLNEMGLLPGFNLNYSDLMSNYFGLPTKTYDFVPAMKTNIAPKLNVSGIDPRNINIPNTLKYYNK